MELVTVFKEIFERSQKLKEDYKISATLRFFINVTVLQLCMRIH